MADHGSEMAADRDFTASTPASLMQGIGVHQEGMLLATLTEHPQRQLVESLSLGCERPSSTVPVRPTVQLVMEGVQLSTGNQKKIGGVLTVS